MFEPCSVESGLDLSAKSFDTDQPVQSVQANLCLNVSLLVSLPQVKGKFYLKVQSMLYKTDFLWIHNSVRTWMKL